MTSIGGKSVEPLLKVSRGRVEGLGECSSKRVWRESHIFERRLISGFEGGDMELGLERTEEHAKRPVVGQDLYTDISQ